jgi:hypothetical protein
MGPFSASYQSWTYEELRRLAIQLQLANARRKSRTELLEMLDGESQPGRFQNLENRRQLTIPGLR